MNKKKAVMAATILSGLNPVARDERVKRKVAIEQKAAVRSREQKLRDAKRKFLTEQKKIETARSIHKKAEDRWVKEQARWNKISTSLI